MHTNNRNSNREIDMQSIKDFFIKLGYSFGDNDSDIKPCSLRLFENYDLSQKLSGKVYLYDCNNSSKTSFYLFTIHFEENELYEVRRFIWNQNKYDLYFTTSKTKQNEFEYALFYAQSDPITPFKPIDRFKGNKEDIAKLEKIKKWKFESGAFWYEYEELHKRIKRSKKVDGGLIETLIRLRDDLLKEYKKYSNKKEIVQALIDRTLFIKFLEDNHIINSDFYQHFFKDKDLEYKLLLNNPERKNDINELFKKINSIFNNVLFETPEIKNEDLKDNALNAIYHSIKGTRKDGQLALFDFRFDVIPVEFIGHIYEVFLEKKQRKEGIYYTPQKLTQLIVDNTIMQKGTVLDPGCGSGMFLVLAFRKLLKEFSKEPDGIKQKIEFRNKLIKDYIFGIEKQADARRLAVFSLYLVLLQGLDAEQVNDLIKEKLQTEDELSLFPYDFTDNILKANSLETQTGKIPHENLTFDFILGNPPFAGIDDSSTIETEFLKKHILYVKNPETKKTVEYKSGDLVGDKQISQCFMLKIKDWATPKTRFGFVINSSNFYNEQANKFQNFFFKYYQIEKFFELSEVKNILFRTARESVCTVVFNNNPVNNNIFKYQPVHLEKFSETFDLLIIHEDKIIQLKQQDLLNKKTRFRDYLIGNENDRQLITELSNNKKLREFLLINEDFDSLQGLTRKANTEIVSFFNIPLEEFNKLTKTEKGELHKQYDLIHYLHEEKTSNYPIPFIYEYNLIEEFQLTGVDGYTNINLVNSGNFQRARNRFIYKGKNILFCRVGTRIKAVFCDYDKVFSVNIFGIKLEKPYLYYLFTALLNSDIINYYTNLKFKKRQHDNFPRVDSNGVKNIPIPKYLDNDLVKEISKISKQLTRGELRYQGLIKEKLNGYIFDLYNLNILEKTRILDFFATKRDVAKAEMEQYKENLRQTIEIYFRKTPVIKHYSGENLPFQMRIVVIFFKGSEAQMPSGKQVLQYIIHELMKYGANFIAMKEKIFGNNCIYIIKDNNYQNWTLTKAFEDGQDIIKKLRS